MSIWVSNGISVATTLVQKPESTHLIQRIGRNKIRVDGDGDCCVCGDFTLVFFFFSRRFSFLIITNMMI